MEQLVCVLAAREAAFGRAAEVLPQVGEEIAELKRLNAPCRAAPRERREGGLDAPPG